VSQYATKAEFDVHGIRPASIPPAITEAEVVAKIIAASGTADSYLNSHFRTPLTSWGVDLTQAVCAIAAYELVASLLIFQPEASANQVMTERKNAAIRWLEQVSAGIAKPVGIVEAVEATTTAPRVSSLPSRGWTHRCR
jgi:phage gp36-like protein